MSSNRLVKKRIIDLIRETSRIWDFRITSFKEYTLYDPDSQRRIVIDVWADETKIHLYDRNGNKVESIQVSWLDAWKVNWIIRGRVKSGSASAEQKRLDKVDEFLS